MKTLPGAEFVRLKLLFLETPFPIFLDIVLIFSCPLWTRFLRIRCIFFPVDVSRSVTKVRLASGGKENLRSGSAGVAGVTVIGGACVPSADWSGGGSIEMDRLVLISRIVSRTSDTMTIEPDCVTAERDPVSTEDLTEIALVSSSGNIQREVHVR